MCGESESELKNKFENHGRKKSVRVKGRLENLQNERRGDTGVERCFGKSEERRIYCNNRAERFRKVNTNAYNGMLRYADKR